MWYLDGDTKQITEDWFSKNQLDWLKERREEVKKGKIPPKIFPVKYKQNADYIVVWTRAIGYRPYVVYVPHTTTDTAQVSGNYHSYGSSGYDWGTFSSDVQIQRTYYQATTNTRTFVDVVATVFDGHNGKKLYETWHRGNWRWSKPDKDCLVDAVKYLRGELNP